MLPFCANCSPKCSKASAVGRLGLALSQRIGLQYWRISGRSHTSRVVGVFPCPLMPRSTTNTLWSGKTCFTRLPRPMPFNGASRMVCTCTSAAFPMHVSAVIPLRQLRDEPYDSIVICRLKYAYICFYSSSYQTLLIAFLTLTSRECDASDMSWLMKLSSLARQQLPFC